MSGFIERKVESLTLGDKLKKIRKESGISLSEISVKIKVKKDYLEKIEAGEFNKLPFDVYVKGFLRNYAKYLNLNSEKVIEQFNKEIGVRDNIKKYQEKGVKKFDYSFPNLIITPKIISITFSVILFLIGFLYFYLEVDSFSKKPDLEILSPSSSEIVKDNFTEIIGITSFENKVNINNEPVYVDSEGKFRQKVGLEKGSNEIIIEAFNKFEKNSKKIVNIVSDYELTVLGVESEKEESQEGQEYFIVEIESQEEEVDLKFKVDDNKIQLSKITPGLSLKIKVKQNLEINSSDFDKIYAKIDEGEFFVLNENLEQLINKIILDRKGIVLNKEANLNKN